MDELLARLRAAVRRTESAPLAPGEDAVVDDGGLHHRPAGQEGLRRRHDVRLTPTEWHLLEILVPTPVGWSRQKHLLQEVWGVVPRATETNYLRVYMAQLRRKLETDPSHPGYLITEPGMGYRFERLTPRR